jgi:hypothetical protein
VMEWAKAEHLKIHNRLHAAYVGKDVTLKNSKYGKNRRGRIADLIFTYDVSFGVDIYRTDGNGFCEERQWVNPRYVSLLTPAPNTPMLPETETMT